MKFRYLILALIGFFLSNSAAIADDKFEGTMLSISASERQEVEEDLLLARMRYEHEAKDPREVQNTINRKIKRALTLGERYDSVQVATEHYNIYKHYPNRRVDNNKYVWRGSQSISLKSKDSDSLLKLAGELQDVGLLMNGLSYAVSPEKHEMIKDGLMEKAIAKLMQRAKRAAKALGKDDIEFATLNVNANNYYQPPMPRAYARADGMAEKSMAAPVAAPGQSQISLTVSAMVRINK